MTKNNHVVKRNWFFILVTSIAALTLAGTAAYFSVFGLTQLFYAAGIGITILAASLEFAKIVTVSYVYRFWKFIETGLKAFYIFAVVFIMFLTSMGIYGFLTSAYQKSANKIELRDAHIKMAENKKTLFINQLDRVNKTIESSGKRIDLLSGLRIQQENRLDNRTSQLGVKVIHANSPQAKGRVEKMNGTFQRRLVKEMRLAKINTLDEANIFLSDVFIPKFGQQFAESWEGPRPRGPSGSGFSTESTGARLPHGNTVIFSGGQSG